MRTIIPSNVYLVPDNANLVFHGKIFDVYQWEQEQFDGTYKTFEMLKRPDTVSVIGVKDDKLVMINHRQPGHEMILDLPGGRHDIVSETELEAAKREMHEETGMAFSNWKLVYAWQPVIKMEWFVYTYVATEFISQDPQRLDAGEKISVELMDFDDVLRTARDDNTLTYGLPKELLERAGSLRGLMSLPEYKA